MATLYAQGTKFSFTPLPLQKSDGFARVEICLENERLSYREVEERISLDEVENLLFSISRLLAGGYGSEYSLSFERAGLAVDLYPPDEKGRALSREERRKGDSMMAVRLLMYSKDKTEFLGGVYSIYFHKNEIEKFVCALRKEYDENYAHLVHGMGEYLFVGVSPLGYEGCNYWYLDTSKEIKAGDYVWAKMGRHNREQVLYVDSARAFTEETAPYPPNTVKRILRKATAREVWLAKLKMRLKR